MVNKCKQIAIVTYVNMILNRLFTLLKVVIFRWESGQDWWESGQD
jgi:hypothetical protein